jgi:hypothetical protein
MPAVALEGPRSMVDEKRSEARDVGIAPSMLVAIPDPEPIGLFGGQVVALTEACAEASYAHFLGIVSVAVWTIKVFRNTFSEVAWTSLADANIILYAHPG